jgi:hypothetical protein
MMIASYIELKENPVLISRFHGRGHMNTPTGTFIARVRNGAIQLPPLLFAWCKAQKWTLFHFRVVSEDQLIMMPVLQDDAGSNFQASLDTEGTVWIPGDIRALIDLHEQSVMLRVEGGAISVYLRKVFDTLGFRPRY